jgi:hypothetical protein
VGGSIPPASTNFHLVRSTPNKSAVLSLSFRRMRARWEALEEFTRRQIHDWIEDLLEQQCAAYWATASERRAEDAPEGYGNGHGKPRHLSKIAGTMRTRAAAGYWLN